MSPELSSDSFYEHLLHHTNVEIQYLMQFNKNSRFIMQVSIMNPKHYIWLFIIWASAETVSFSVSCYYCLLNQSSKVTLRETWGLAGVALSNVQCKRGTPLCCHTCLVCAVHHKTLKTVRLPHFVASFWSHKIEFRECCTAYDALSS